MRSMTFLVNDRSTGSGPTPAVAVTLTENANGTISVSINVVGSVTGDLRGFFFDIANESRIGTLSVTPTSPGFTEFRQGNDNVKDLGNGANMNGLLGSDGGYDAGVEIGNAGIGHGDDYQSFSFTLKSSAGPLTLDDFANVDIGVRLTSVGRDDNCHDDRNGDGKLLEHTTAAIDAKDDTGAVTEDAAVNKVTGNVFANDLYLQPVHLITAVNGSASNIGGEINGVYGTFRLNLDGSYTYKLDNSRAATQALAAGQQVIESFAYTAKSSDEATSSSSDSATVRITITGAADNSAPVITTAVATGAVTELPDHAPGETSQLHVASGTVNFTDANLTDTHSVAVAATGAGYLGSFNAAITNSATGDGVGQVTWTFQVLDGTVEHLGAGQQLKQNYVLTLDDGHGGTASQAVAITITGANDGPVITGAVNAGAVTEDAILAASGTVDFADIDLNDGHTVSVAPGALGYLGTFNAAVGDDSTGDGTGHVSWDFHVANGALQFLGEGDSLTQTYQVSVDDGHGGTASQAVTIHINGANDAPEIVAGSDTSGQVFEDGSRHDSGQLVAVDVDQHSTLTWTVDNPSVVATPDYRFLIDNLSIVRNGVTFFNDDFGAGGPPPQAPNSVGGGVLSYGTQGLFAEAGGRAIMDGSGSVVTNGLGSPIAFHGSSALLLTDNSNDPANLALGLKIDDDFTVEGRFDLVLPQEALQSYGIRLIDTNGSDTVDVRVRLDEDGVLRVVMREVDVPTNTIHILGSVDLHPQAGENQIVLRLTHSAADAGAIHASFDLIGGAVPHSFTVAGVGHIFGTDTPGDPSDDELFTRAQIVAVAPSDLQNGTYGTLHVDGSGEWSYALDNAAASVQALAQGEHATDTFTVKVTDEHGAFDTQTVSIDVAGSNDAPVINIAASTTSAFLFEDMPGGSASGQIVAGDVDHGAVLHWTVGPTSQSPVPGVPNTLQFFGYQGNFHFTVDQLTVSKNGVLAFNDTFSDGVPPPSVPAPGFALSYLIGGGYTESPDGRLHLDGGSLATFSRGIDNPDLLAGFFTLLGSNVDPSDMTRGLKSDDDFTVEARYDLALPDVGQGYGITLTDNANGTTPPDQLGDSNVALVVRRVDGNLVVQFYDFNNVTDHRTGVQAIPLAPLPDETQIVMRLVHDADHVGLVHGEFDLVGAGGTRTFTFGDVAHIFGSATPGYAGDDENFTRAQLIAFGPDNNANTTSLAGTYGTLSVQQNGEWTYALDPIASQTLAQGQIALDTFAVRVTDEYGLSNFRSVFVNVAGVNDAPVTTGGVTSGEVVEDTTFFAFGNVAFRDVDLIDFHTASATPSPFNTTTLGTFSVISVNEPPNSPDGTVAWTYSLDNGAAQHLAQGQSVFETYSVAVTDNWGATATQDVTVTITGTNDGPDAVDDVLGGSAGGGGAMSVAVVYQNFSSTISATVDQINNDTWFDFTATAVHYPDADSIGELAQYDVVLLGNSYNEQFSADFWAAIRQYSESAEGGVVSNGWTNFSLGQVRSAFGLVARDDYDAVVPVTGEFQNTDSYLPFVPLSGGHPITDGISGIQAGFYVTSSLSLDPGAVSLATLFGSDSALAYQDQPGAGHTVYLGFHYTDAQYHDATMANSVDGDRLLEQALHWAGGGAGGDAATDEDHALSVSGASLLSNDTDVDTGDTLSITSVSATSTLGAAVSLDGFGNVTYDPTLALQYLAKGQTADDSFSYTISDNHGATDTASVTLSVAGVNDAPLTTGGVTTGELVEDANLLASGDVSFTDVDLIDGHTATFSASPFNSTALGTFSLGSVNESPATADGSVSWSYALNSGAVQSLAEGQTVLEAYAVTIADGEGASATRDVIVAITGANDGPDAIDDVLGGSGGGGAMSVAVVYQNLSSAISGTVDQINNDTWFDFTATAVHYTDADSIAELAQYDVVLLGNSYYETFSAEFWAAIHQYSTSAERGVVSNGWTNYSLDQVLSAFGSTANADYDAAVPITGNDNLYNVGFAPLVPLSGGHPITDGISSVQAGYYVTASLSLDPGAVSLATLFGSDSALAYQDQLGGHTVYLGFHYTDAEYRDVAMANSVDGDRLLEQALHWAGSAAAATDEDHALTISGATLLANDTDIDTGDLLSILSVSGTSTLGGSVSLDALGNVVYDPTQALQYLAEGEVVTDTFTYTISDNHGATDSATVSLTVRGVADLGPNTPPVANPDTNAGDAVIEAGGFTQPGFPPSGDPTAFGNVLANDFDPDPNPGLHVTSVNGFEPSSFLPVFGTYGRLFLQSDGSWNYILDDLDPDTDALAQGATAVDQFTYTVSDSQGASATSTLSVAINGTNDVPVANADSATASENGAATIAVLANDHDPDTGAVLRLGALFSPMSNGSVSTLGATLLANPDGTVRYDPRTSAMLRALNDGESVTDSFNYIVFDEKGASAGGTVSVLVQGANNVAPEGQVFEDGSRHASGHLTPPPGIDAGSASWTVDDSTFVATPDYRFSMDALRITRNGATYFEDEFTAGGPPPQAPTLSGTTTPVSYFLPTGTSIIESNGRAILDGSFSAPINAIGNPEPFHGNSATLNTDVTSDLALGLKIDDDFRVEGRFDLVFPDQPLEAYGIRLVDQNGSDTVDVRVRMEPNGSLTVVLREVDVPTNSITILGSVALAPATGENQIVLRLTHSPAEPGAIHASFSLLNQTPTGTIGRDFDFGTAAGHIFGTGTPGDASDDELYTRVQISAVAPSDLQNGAFGTLHLDADGDWTYALDNSSPAVQALAQGEHASDTFTVSVSDGVGGHVTKTIAVDVVGSGDFPAVSSAAPSAFNGGYVVEDGPLSQQQVTGSAFGSDVDHGATLHWSVSRNPYSSNYLFRLDDLTVTKNGDAFFNDGFDGGGAPPALPPGVITGFGYATSGTLSETGGRLVFNGQVAAARQGVGVDELVAGHLLTLISNTDPADLTRGLKSDDDFTVTARYDLSLPGTNGQSYGVSLTDNMSGGLPPDQQGDDVITVEVARVGGEVRVQFLDRDVAADSTTVLQSMLLTPLVGEDQIVLRLSHAASELGTVHASFDLLSGGALSRHLEFIQTAHIFGTDTPGYAGDDEDWTRVQLITTGPDQGGTFVQGTYGSFSIDAATGAWTYTLDNGLPAVQNLASGAAVTDNFNLRVIDEHGLSTSRAFNFTVVGTADGPAPTTPTTVVPDPVNNPTQQIITGTGGNDLITGGSGADLLFGLSGADTFDFNNLGDAGDTVADFSSSQGDKLDLRDLIASLPGYMPGVTDPASLVFFNEFAPVPGSRPGTSVFVDQDGVPSGPAVLVAQLDGMTGLQYSDLILS